MAYQSMMEMEHSDWFLSRSIFSSPDRQMDRSRHARFVLLWTINLFQSCVASSKKVSLSKKLNGKN